MEFLLQLKAAGGLEGRLQIGIAGNAEPLLGIEAPQPIDKHAVPEPTSQHVKEHQRLVVAHRFGGLAVLGTELCEGEVLLPSHVVAVLLQCGAPVGDTPAALLLD